MESLLYHLIDYIKTQIPELQTVDEDYGQLEALDNEETDTYPVLFPALLINANETEWTCLQGKSQKGETQLVFRLCLDCYDDTHAGSGTLEKILVRQQQVQDLHEILQCFRPMDDGGLIRTRSKSYTWNHGIKIYELYYTISVQDIIKETVTTQKPNLKISASKL
jgi:hypothetical protein